LGDLPNLRYVHVRDAGLTGDIPGEICALSDYGCDGIACRAGSFQFPHGRQTSNSTPCLACPAFSNFIGRTHCDATTRDSLVPSTSPTVHPSALPSFAPSAAPSNSPTRNPSAAPSVQPTISPSMNPSIIPTMVESDSPSLTWSDVPSLFPTQVSSGSIHPSVIPSIAPTIGPIFSRNPSVQPSVTPSYDDPTPLPSKEASLPTVVPSSVPTFLPLDALSTTPSPTGVDLSESPTSEPTTKTLSPSSDFVVGGLNQGSYADDSPKGWTWSVLAVILCAAACVLFGLVVLGRRRRRSELEQSDSTDCLPDIDGVNELPPAPRHGAVDPFSFPEIKAQQVTSLSWLLLLHYTAQQLTRISLLSFSPRHLSRKKVQLGSRTTIVSSTLVQQLIAIRLACIACQYPSNREMVTCCWLNWKTR
jgi:hypothetical protein